MADIAFLTERMRLGFGVDLVVDQVAAGLAARGHDVTVYASYEDGTYQDRPYTLDRLGVPAMRYAPLYDLESRRRAHIAKLRERPHDVFFVETQPFFTLIPGLGGRAIAVDHGVSDARGFPLRVQVNAKFVELTQQRWYFRSSPRIVTVSDFLRRQLPPPLQDRTTPIYNGADHYPLPTEDERAAMRERLGVGDDHVLVLYVGRLNPTHQPYKGTQELLTAWLGVHADCPDATLVMAGFGTDGDADWVRSAGAVPFVNVPVEDMPALLGAADLYVTASKWEGFDLPAVEAQRAGAPTVAYRVGAHPEVVEDGHSGILVSSRRGFADAMRELIRDGGRRRAMSARAAEWATRFTWAEAVERYEEVVRTAVADRRVSPGDP